MALLEKIGEISGYVSKSFNQTVRFMEAHGYVLVGDDAYKDHYKTYHVMVDKELKRKLEE